MARSKEPELDLTKVTRVHIVTDLGHYENWADSWEAVMQDDGRTLKLFGKGEGAQAKANRLTSLMEETNDQIEEQRARMIAAQIERNK